jgi:hypothetical protein
MYAVASFGHHYTQHEGEKEITIKEHALSNYKGARVNQVSILWA